MERRNRGSFHQSSAERMSSRPTRTVRRDEHCCAVAHAHTCPAMFGLCGIGNVLHALCVLVGVAGKFFFFYMDGAESTSSLIYKERVVKDKGMMTLFCSLLLFLSPLSLLNPSPSCLLLLCLSVSLSLSLSPAQPPTVACKPEAQSEHVHVAYTFFSLHVPEPTRMLRWCLATKISASEPSREVY